MTPPKTISTFAWTLLAFLACSASSLKAVQSEPLNLDAVCGITTKQLGATKSQTAFLNDWLFQTAVQRKSFAPVEVCNGNRYHLNGQRIS